MTTHRSSRRTGAIGALVLALTLFATSLTPHAAAAVDVRIVDPQLASLPFGKGIDAIAAWLDKRIDKLWAARIARAADPRDRARLKAERDRELEQIREDEKIFDGRATGLEQSIVAGEFGVGTGESLFRWKEGDETHYFFMHEGRLWKYLRVLAPGPTYALRMAQFQRGLGEPVEMGDEADGEGGRRLILTLWQKGDMDIRLVNRRVVYGADVFVMEQRPVAKSLAERRKARGQTGSQSYDSIEIFFLEDPHTYGAPTPKP